MLLIPSMPLADPYGEFLQTSRLELWLVDVASLSELWKQWTGGLPYASWLDRIPILLLASGWLAVSWCIGHPIAKRESLDQWNGPMATHGFSIAIGHAILSQLTLVLGWIFGPRSFLPLALSTVLLALALRWLFGSFRSQAVTPQVDNASARDASESMSRSIPLELLEPLEPLEHLEEPNSRSTENDPSFASSWSRRLIGLSFVGSCWLAAIALLGSCLPSYDADVREIEMLSTKKYFLDNSIVWFDFHRAANGPQGSIMPALAITSLLETFNPSETPEAMLRHLTCAWLSGQVLHASLWLIAILLIASNIRSRSGALAAALIAFLLVAHPGMHELVRLGGRAGGVMLWIAASMVLIQMPNRKSIPSLCAWCIATGALSYQTLLGIIVGNILLHWVIYRDPRDRTGELRKSHSIASRYGIAKIAMLSVAIVAAVPWQLRAYLHGPPLSHDFLPTMAIAHSNIAMLGASFRDVAEAFHGILWNSMAHGLLLMPLAAIGAVLGYRDRNIRFTSIVWLVWILLWWVFTTHLDRDWVVATPMLAWPAARAIQWLRERSGGYWLFPLGLISLAWSTIALAAWPTADPRLLVAIDQLIPASIANARTNNQAKAGKGDAEPDNSGAGEGRGEDREGIAKDREGRAGQGWAVNSNPIAVPPSNSLSANPSTYPIYTDWINRFPASHNISTISTISTIAPATDRWLVIGTADTFFLTVPTLEVGPGELASLEPLLRSNSSLPDPPKSPGQPMAPNQPKAPDPPKALVRYLVIDWRGIADGDRVARSNFETSMRDAVLKLEQSGAISRVPWDYLSSDAECFSVEPALK